MAVVQQSMQFLREVVAEFKKVTWPTRKDVVAATIVVVVLVAIVALYVGAIDFVLSRFLAVVLR